MYFAVAKFVFEHEMLSGHERKELYGLVERIRSKFKVCVKPSQEFQREGEPSLVIASLSVSETELNKELDAIADFCENSGFGRIASEVSFMDHLDSLVED